MVAMMNIPELQVYSDSLDAIRLIHDEDIGFHRHLSIIREFEAF